jgi:hypothetical protein
MAEAPHEPTESNADENDARRPYSTPVLRVFGTVAAMTAAQTKAQTHQADGGAVNTKT